VGPWRATEAEAQEDALRAGLATRSGSQLVWRVSGAIEQDIMPFVPQVPPPRQ
jgi:hypothetical protein